MDLKYISLCERACSKADLSEGSYPRQHFIGIGGPPGSGKSTLAAAVCELVDARLGQGSCVVLPMDGFHYSRSELRAMGASGTAIGDPASSMGPGGSTTYDDLLCRRGAPWTFNGQDIVETFQRAKRDAQLVFPTYCRSKSDPVPDGTRLLASHRVVLCEGNYLLALDDPSFCGLAGVWDDRWYVSADAALIKGRLIERHLETWSEEKTQLWGAGREGASAKAEANDLKNARWVEEASRKHADVVVESE